MDSPNKVKTMTHIEQIEAFNNDVDSLCFRYAQEFDLLPSDLAGALMVTAMDMARSKPDEEADEG